MTSASQFESSGALCVGLLEVPNRGTLGENVISHEPFARGWRKVANCTSPIDSTLLKPLRYMSEHVPIGLENLPSILLSVQQPMGIT